jgi:hypothetical protein
MDLTSCFDDAASDLSCDINEPKQAATKGYFEIKRSNEAILVIKANRLGQTGAVGVGL